MAFGRINRLGHQMAKLEGVEVATQSARAKLDTAERSMDHMFNTLIQVRELTIQAINAPLSAGNRAALVIEVQALKSQFEAISAAQHDGQYIFSGTQTDLPPIDVNGAYQGAGAGMVVEIGENSQIDLAIDGQQLFDSGVNVMQVFDDIITQLQANDTAGLSGSLDSVTTAQDQMIAGRTEVGALLSRVGIAEQLNEDMKVVLVREDSQAGDTDLASAVSELIVQERSLQAAVQIAGRSLQPSLLDIL